MFVLDFKAQTKLNSRCFHQAHSCTNVKHTNFMNVFDRRKKEIQLLNFILWLFLFLTQFEFYHWGLNGSFQMFLGRGGQNLLVTCYCCQHLFLVKLCLARDPQFIWILLTCSMEILCTSWLLVKKLEEVRCEEKYWMRKLSLLIMLTFLCFNFFQAHKRQNDGKQCKNVSLV